MLIRRRSIRRAFNSSRIQFVRVFSLINKGDGEGEGWMWERGSNVHDNLTLTRHPHPHPHPILIPLR